MGIDALTLVTSLHLLALCRGAVRLAEARHPTALPPRRSGRPRSYAPQSLLLIALLRILWHLSYADLSAWLHAWPALALACGLPLGPQGCPRVPCPATQCLRARQTGAPVDEVLFITAVREAVTRLRDLVVDSATVLAWRRDDPDAAYGHAPAHHTSAFLRGFRVHTVLCRGSGLPAFFRVAPASAHDAPFAQPLLAAVVALYSRCPRVVRLDAAY